MNQDLRVAMIASLQDRLVAPLRRTLDAVERNLKDVQRELQGTQRESAKAGRAMAEISGPERATRQVALLARNTQHATTLAERMERAWTRTGNLVKGVASGFAALQAAKYVLATPVQQAVGYERQLANASNIAYGPAERRAGMKEMDEAVVGAVQAGGGSRESALKAMGALFAANIDKKDVLTLLPTMQKYATAGNADPENIAQLVIYGLRSLKLPASQIPLMLDKTLASTKGGSMEFDSLAKWMPQVGAAGGAAGLSGMGGYEQMLAALQVSRLTAGTKDEGGTNLKDLLSLINGHALMTAAKRLGIDAAGSIAGHIGKGGNALSGIVALADHVANSDPRFAALDKKLKGSQVQRDKSGAPVYTPEQEDVMRQQAVLFQGSALGKLFHNQQSMQALVALRNNRDYFKTLVDGTNAATGQVGEQDFNTIKDTASFRFEQKANEELFAQTRALQSATSALGQYTEGATALYRKYPGFAEVVEIAKLAIGALAAAAAGAGAALLLLGGGRAGAAAAGAAAGARTAGGAAAAAAAGGRFSYLMNGPATSAATGAAAAGGVLAPVAAAAAMPLAVLGAGMFMSDRLNSTHGLSDRIASRSRRISELEQLAKLDNNPGKYRGEIEQLNADREAMRQQYGAQVGGGRGTINPATLADRVAARSQRVSELGQLASMEPDGGKGRGDAAGTASDVTGRQQRADPVGVLGSGIPPVNLNVFLDGQLIQSSVNRRNEAAARRN